MLHSSKAIKANARLLLKNNWPQCILASIAGVLAIFCITLLYSVVFSILSPVMYRGDKMSIPGMTIKLFAFVIFAVLVIPIIGGTIRWFWFFSLKNTLALREIFYYYSSVSLLFKSLFLGLRIFAEFVLTAVICTLPAGILFAVYNNDVSILVGYSESMNKAVYITAVALFLVISIPLAVKVFLRCVLAPFIMIINEDIDPFYAITLSKKILRGHRNENFKTFLAFFAWIALSVFGGTIVYTFPFLLVSYAVFARYAIANHRIECEKDGTKPLI